MAARLGSMQGSAEVSAGRRIPLRVFVLQREGQRRSTSWPKGLLTRHAPADEDAGARYPLPKGEGSLRNRGYPLPAARTADPKRNAGCNFGPVIQLFYLM